MVTAGHHGICPSCDAMGEVGSPCSAAGCERRGYHLIPAGYARQNDALLDPLIGQCWNGYLLIDKLGEGGIGAVYLAQQQPVGLRVAVKVLHSRQQRTSTLAQRFDAEAAALARLVHPNIVRLMGSGHGHNRAFIAMEYIEGRRTLESVMRSGLSHDDSRRILIQLIDALDSAHQVKVIHRDIKPSNIMLQTTVREPHFVRIVDFGLVKFTDEGGSTQVAAGTPTYMAPEQARRSNIGPWTDWYAVGIIASELITGRRAYPPMANQVLLRLKVLGEIQPMSSAEDLDLPPAVRQLVERTTALEPEARPRTAHEMIQLVEAAFAELHLRDETAVQPDFQNLESVSTSIDMRGMIHEQVDASATRRANVLGIALLAGPLLAMAGWWFLPDDPPIAARSGDTRQANEHALPADLTPTNRDIRQLEFDSAILLIAPDADVSAEPAQPDAMPDAAELRPQRPRTKRSSRQTTPPKRGARKPRDIKIREL